LASRWKPIAPDKLKRNHLGMVHSTWLVMVAPVSNARRPLADKKILHCIITITFCW